VGDQLLTHPSICGAHHKQSLYAESVYDVDLLCELMTSLLITGIQMGKMSKLGWLIGLIKHAVCADSMYFLYLLLISISKILA
jgi:hypothetical protein